MMTRSQALAQLTQQGQDYALETVEVDSKPLLWFTNGPSSLRALYEQSLSDLPFIVYENQRLSFKQAWQEACKIGHIMVHQYGVQKADRVAISMRNYPEWMIAFMAVTSIGAIAVAMNALWLAEEMAFGLTDSGAKLLVADSQRIERLAQATRVAGLRVISVRAPKHHRGLAAYDIQAWDTLMATQSDATEMPAAALALDDPTKMLYTSGSTGHPKGVLTTHRNVLAALLSWELDAKASELATGIAAPVLDFQTATLLGVPLFHVTGLNACYLTCYRAQRRIVCMYKWNPEQAAALIAQERINVFIAPAAMTGDLVQVAASTGHDLSSLMVVGGGGAARAASQVQQIDVTFANALPNTGWGMTETCAIGTGIGGPDYLKRPESSGRCSAVLELRIMDEQGKVLGTGERGELLVRGTSVFKGYWNRPQANAESFVEGWFKTGDVAYLDEEGYLFIVDRMKDLIIRGGENIGCGKVENALLMFPGVIEACAYAVPDDRLGEEVGATVHATRPLDLNALRQHLDQHLARFEIPRYIFQAEAALPRTPSGKILKREIRQQALAQLPEI